MSQSIQDVRPRSLLLGHHRKVKGIDAKIKDLKLRGQDWRANVTDAVISAKLTRSIESASTIELGINDPRGRLRRSKLLEERFDIELSDLFFRFVAANKQGSTLNLTFEDREIARLRKEKGPKKAYRDQVTRAEFVLMLLREIKDPGIPAWIPELHEKQPIEKAQGLGREINVSETQGSKGISRGAKLTVKGAPATSEQIKVGERSLQIAASLNAPWQAAAALIAAEIVESTMRNLHSGDADSLGVLQVRVSTSGSASKSLDIEWCVKEFLLHGFWGKGGAIALAKQGMSPGNIAQQVQGSAFPSAYGQYMDEALNWLKAFHGGSFSGGSATVTTTVAKRYAFERKRNENSWKAIQRLAEEVGWVAFVANGIFYYASEPEFLDAKIQMEVGEHHPGVDAIDWDWDMGKKVQEVTVTGRAKRWAAPPGTAVDVDGQGPANGRYIVSQIESDLFDENVTVTLKRPTKPLPEPAPETKTKTSTSRFPSGGGASSLKGVHVRTQPGPPHWGGSNDIMRQFVEPFMKKRGLPLGSGKRTPAENASVGGSPNSDHLTTHTTAFARDFPTGSGEDDARALAKAMGNNGWQANSYDTFNISVDGHSFRVQILWGAGIGHGDHVHVGISA